MKVILLRDVAKVGKIHDIKEVSDGYALNSLIPRGLAAPATEGRLSALKAERAKHNAKVDADHAALFARVKEMNGSQFDVVVKADQKGHLYQKLTAEKIAQALKLSEQAVQLVEPIKTLGTYPLDIRVESLKAHVTLVVKGE